MQLKNVLLEAILFRKNEEFRHYSWGFLVKIALILLVVLSVITILEDVVYTLYVLDEKVTMTTDYLLSIGEFIFVNARNIILTVFFAGLAVYLVGMVKNTEYEISDCIKISFLNFIPISILQHVSLFFVDRFYVVVAIIAFIVLILVSFKMVKFVE